MDTTATEAPRKGTLGADERRPHIDKMLPLIIRAKELGIDIDAAAGTPAICGPMTRRLPCVMGAVSIEIAAFL